MNEIRNKRFKIQRIIWYNQPSKWGVLATEPLESLDGYEVKLVNDFSNICIAGNFEGAYEGAEIIVSGDIISNVKYGKQIQIKQIKIMADTKSREGIVNFLSRSVIKGISTVNANKIYDEFKEDSIDIVLNKTEALSAIRGIGEKTVDKVKESVFYYKRIEDLIKYCTSLGLSYTLIMKLDEALGEEALKVVKENPYKVMDITTTIPFSQLDEMFLNAGGDPRANVRLKTGLVYMLKKLSTLEGSTGCYSTVLRKKYLSMLGFEDREEVLYWKTLTDLKNAGVVVIGKIKGELKEYEVVFVKEYLDMEERIAGALHFLEHEGDKNLPISRQVIEEEIADFEFKLNEQQIKAVNNCLKHKVSVLTGSAGTGKSSITKALYRIYERSSYKVVLLSPTAKACRRLEECTGGVAQTIHRFLGVQADGNFPEFAETYPENTVIIIDEASMLDIILFDKVLERVAPDTRILLVGDNNQLPSVQAGNVLGDVINSKDVHVSILTDVMRQQETSYIIKFCNMINDGKIFDPCEYSDFHYEEFGTAEELKDVLFPKYLEEVARNGLNSVQVITPYKQGEIGMNNLNTMLQTIYQEKLEGKKVIEPYRMGDKVRHIQNNYKKDVYNGETGVIVAAEDNEILVDFGNKKRAYEGADLEELTLSYASTVHASQGSEYAAVFVILDDTAVNNFLHTRRLLYTAVSRGKQKVYILTKPFLVDRCIENKSYRPRITKLKEMLASLKKGSKNEV